MTVPQPTHKDVAEFLRLGLIAGVCDVSSVVAWADSVITETEKPPFAFLDLSTSGEEPSSSVQSFLRGIPGDLTPELSARMLLGHCHRVMKARPFSLSEAFPELLVRLYRMADSNNFPDRITSNLIEMEDGFSLARDQNYEVYGTMRDVEVNFIAFLSEFDAYAPNLPE